MKNIFRLGGFSVLLFLIVFLDSVQAQQPSPTVTIIRGKISDENGELLIGATVVLTSDKSKGTVTDLDGNYSLKIPGSGSKSLTVSYIGYKPTEEKVELKPGQVVIKNFTLKSESISIKEAVITAKAIKTTDSYMEKLKAKSAVSIDYISGATIKRTGDANVGAAIARIPGVSTNGSFITVRGIGDRYVKTAINGALIPTLDPFTNNIKLDIFPASMVDNITVSKTASPDLPGDWSGAYLSIETKDYPEELSINLETSFEYNPQSSFKNIVSSQRSSTDWLGYDNTFREYDHKSFQNAIPDPTTYQQLVAIGLGGYYDSIGVTGNVVWNDDYFKLGLIQLGLLAPANFNNAAEFNKAKNEFYSGSYPITAFYKLNEGAAASGQAFPNNWDVKYRENSLNFSQTLSIGNQFEVAGKSVGFIAGFRYGTSTVSDPESDLNRTTIGTTGNLIHYVGIKQEVSKETNGWNALISTSIKLNKNNSFSFLFMPNIAGINNVRKAIDYVDFAQKGNRILSQFYEHRQQLVYQLKSEHYLPHSKVKIGLNASYTRARSNVPDFKDLIYTLAPNGEAQILTASRYFRYLSEKLLDCRASLEFPLDNKPGYTRKIKSGISWQSNRRRFDQYEYSVIFGNGLSGIFYNNDLDGFFSTSNFGLSTYMSGEQLIPTLKEYYREYGLPSNHTIGLNDVRSAFIQTDYNLSRSIRVTGGVRTEMSVIFTDVNLYDSLGYADDDERRQNGDDLFVVEPGKIESVDFLPACGIIFSLNKDETVPRNIRLNYSHTVARPSIREIYDGAMYDYEFRADIFGSSDLKSVKIDNFDFRFENYFKSGDNFSTSLFYKSFRNHIELVSSNIGYSWQNADYSKVLGIEFDLRKKIGRNLEFKSNVSLIYSNTTLVQYNLAVNNGVKVYTPIDTVSRTMFGQAPYVLNGIITYSADSLGFTASVVYNVQGPRLVISSTVSDPGVYERPRHLIDIKLSKSILKHWVASLTIRDLLNSPVKRSYRLDNKWIEDYDSYRFGTSYKFSLAYKL